MGLAAASLPGPIVVVLATAGALAGGGLWGGLAGELKRRFGAHEVISTIMLNFIAAAVTSYFVVYHLAMPETIRTAELPPGAALPRLSDVWPAVRGSSLNASLLVAILTCGVASFLLARTRFGFRLRAVGLGPGAAEANGISVGGVHLRALVLGGALAGLVGVNEVLGYRHYFLANFSNGLGFMGIVVALLGGGRPLGVLLAALLIGWMRAAGLVINDLVPREVVDVLQAAVILAVLVVNALRARLGAIPSPAAPSGEPDRV